MATTALLRGGLVCSIIAFVFMFIAFASPYWYQSWERVHSPFGNIGLWHICLSGYIMPHDPIMKSYVGCWWIHSTEFSKITMKIMPVWFRFIQAFSVFVLVGDLLAMIFTALYLLPGARARLYKRRPRMFFIVSGMLLAAAFLVFLISLVFAEKALDDDWMPRPWMNYLSWSYGLCVTSGFFSAFGGMCLLVLGLIYADKEANGDPGVTSAAELDAKRRELEKQDEVMRAEQEMAARYRGPHVGSHAGSHVGSHAGSHAGSVAGSGLVYRPGQPHYYQSHQSGVDRPGQPHHYPSQNSGMDRPGQPHHYPSQNSGMDRPDYYRGGHRPPVAPKPPSAPPSEAGSQSTRVGESVV